MVQEGFELSGLEGELVDLLVERDVLDGIDLLGNDDGGIKLDEAGIFGVDVLNAAPKAGEACGDGGLR